MEKTQLKEAMKLLKEAMAINNELVKELKEADETIKGLKLKITNFRKLLLEAQKNE